MTKIVEKALNNLGYELSVTYKPWARMLAEASTAKYDGALMLPFSLERGKEFVFSTPVLNTRVGFAVTEGCNGRTESPLFWHHREIGAVKDYLKPAVFEKNAEKTMSINNDTTGLKMLAAKRISLFLIDENNFKTQANHVPLPQRRKLQFCPTILESIPLHLGLRKSLPNSEKITAEFNDEIMKLRSSGYIAAVVSRAGIKQ